MGTKKVITIVVFATLLAVGCGEKAAEGPSPDELRNEIAGVAGDLNAYLSEHSFADTDADTMAAEITKAADEYGELEKQAQGLEGESGNEAYGEVAGLAGEGRAKAEALASAVAAGSPSGDTEKVATLHSAIDDWAGYSDKISAPPAGEEPRMGEPSEPGEPRVGEPSEPAAPLYPGKGHHYGWWKNPEWARDRGTRPLTEGEPPGVGDKERERERDRGDKAIGPEREGSQPGSGKGGGKGKKGSG